MRISLNTNYIFHFNYADIFKSGK